MVLEPEALVLLIKSKKDVKRLFFKCIKLTKIIHNDNIMIGDDMKNKKGFTLIELLAVIVILGVILTIATTSVIKSINDSKEKTKFTAAQEIVNMAEAYIATNGADEDGCINVEDMIPNYLDTDVTNPLTGENRTEDNKLTNQQVCADESSRLQEDYKSTGNMYKFDGYVYKLQ